MSVSPVSGTPPPHHAADTPPAKRDDAPRQDHEVKKTPHHRPAEKTKHKVDIKA